jgi:hypothetical protein
MANIGVGGVAAFFRCYGFQGKPTPAAFADYATNTHEAVITQVPKQSFRKCNA